MGASLVLEFCGTRGYIEESSHRHRMHSACLAIYQGSRLLLDVGETWAGKIDCLDPDWIAITHAHPDHSFGLASGTSVPVFVTAESHALLRHYPVSDFRAIKPGRPFRAGPFRVLAYPVVHSVRAPAVGLRVSGGGATIVYNPDVISIPDADDVLRGVDAFIGDGASLTRPLVRRHGNALFGHTTVRAQLNWCKKYGIPRAFIVHCGKQLVQMHQRALQQEVDLMAGDAVRATVTYDGMRAFIRPRSRRARR